MSFHKITPVKKNSHKAAPKPAPKKAAAKKPAAKRPVGRQGR
ncbi:hypothetical protein [Streptomyces sp. NPDC050535]